MTLPKPVKIIGGIPYRLRFRHETKIKAEDSAKYQRLVHSSRKGYLIRVIKLPKDQWGVVSWDKKPWTTYEFLGFSDPELTGGLASLFE